MSEPWFEGLSPDYKTVNLAIKGDKDSLSSSSAKYLTSMHKPGEVILHAKFVGGPRHGEISLVSGDSMKSMNYVIHHDDKKDKIIKGPPDLDDYGLKNPVAEEQEDSQRVYVLTSVEDRGTRTPTGMVLGTYHRIGTYVWTVRAYPIGWEPEYWKCANPKPLPQPVNPKTAVIQEVNAISLHKTAEYAELLTSEQIDTWTKELHQHMKDNDLVQKYLDMKEGKSGA